MLLDDDELKKYLLKQNREFGDRGWEGQGQMSLDKYGSESLSGREGWEDMIRLQLETNQFGDQSPNKSFAERNLPSGLGLLESRERAQQVLGHRLEDNMGPQLYQSPIGMMDTSGPRFVQDPYANAQMNLLPPKYAGTKIPFPYQGTNELRPQINALYSQMNPNRLPGIVHNPRPHEGLGSGTPMAFDDPRIAGTPITAPGGPAGSFGPDYGASPLQMRAMQEQIGGPGFNSPPRFAATNHAQMGPLSSVTLGKSDPNFHAPEFTRSAKPGGLLTESPGTSSKKGSGWMSDDRMRNAQNREFRLAQMMLNFGENSRQDEGWGNPLSHY